MSDPKNLYEGEFLNQNGEIEVKQIESDDKTTIKITRSNPSVATTEQTQITTPSTSSESLSISSASTSGSGSDTTIKKDPEEVKILKEEESKKEFVDLQDIYIKDEPNKKKKKKNIGKSSRKNFEDMKNLYLEFLNHIKTDFMRLFHSLCHKKSNNGVIHDKISEQLLKNLFKMQKNSEYDSGIRFCLLDLQFNWGLIDDVFFDENKYMIFNDNFRKLLLDNLDTDWYYNIEYYKTISEKEEDNFYNFFNNVYFSLVFQCINHMLINRKINMHHITERFLIECIFSIVKLMVFPNIDGGITNTQLYNSVKARDFELEFLGRNVWLRQAWTMYISVLYSENKRNAYKDEEQLDDENAFYFDDLKNAYMLSIDYYFNNIYSKMNDNLLNKPIILKIKNEYENALGVMNMVIYCLKIYYLYRNLIGVDYDIFHRITHAAWLFPKYRSDLEQCDISDDLKKTINVFNYKSLYEDAKHLHSFRSSRTFGTPMPEKYWKSYDPQDSAACIRHDSILLEICFDIANFFGLYEAQNADFAKPQQEVDRLKEILYAKVLNLRSTIASEKERFIEYIMNDDIPDFEKRKIISDLNINLSSQSKEDELNENLKWIKINMDNPRSVFVKIDNEIIENFEKSVYDSSKSSTSSSLENINLIKYDKNVKIQKRKMISFDQLGSDIKIAQSLLRYFEQLFNLFFQEARNNL